ncbi:MAG: S41 family peptidase [Chloroflexi bacterium]|nr:S41 family peptidase [Chloroflexota bacterium]
MGSQTALRGHLRHIPAALALVAVFIAGFALGNQTTIGASAQSTTRPPEGVADDFAHFWQVFNLIQSDYIDPVDIDVLVDGATTGLVEALGDEFSGYMDPETYEMLNTDLEGEFEGIGVVIRTREDTGEIEVVGLLEGAPAEAAGVRPGDVFVTVDDFDVTEVTQMELAARVRGPEGEAVKITMRREDELIDFEIVRARITIPNIEYEVLEDSNIAYLRLNQFSAEARDQIEEAVAAMDVNTRDGLIIDFRDNPGGLLNSAVDVGSAFIASGPIVLEEFGDGRERVFEAAGDPLDIDVPIVVLVNESSASASELVAGALQDTGRATIVGTTTLGKGTVQTWSALVNGGGIRLTIARWLTPNGRWIHENGVTPDIVVEWMPETFDDPNDLQIDAAVDYLESLFTTPITD